MRIFYIIFSVLLLIYLLVPAPQKISQFSPLSDSVKSRLDGDTWQIPNVAAYFSDNYRSFVVPFYAKDYQKLANLPFPPLRLNYPPEFSWTAIKKHTESTYLEELVYPLKGSLFVNGFEPFYEDGQPKYWGAHEFNVDDQSWFTKTTIRFYPSSAWVRLVVWLGITLSILLIYRLGKKIILER